MYLMGAVKAGVAPQARAQLFAWGGPTAGASGAFIPGKWGF